MTMKKIQIRQATPEDLDAVWKMWKEIMEQEVYYPYDTETYSRQDIETEWINLVHNHVYVAISDDVVVAGAFILKQNQPGYGKHICNAAYMVDSVHRGCGIGDALCRYSIKAAKRVGYRGIQFNLVVSTNEAALKIWKRNGFDLIGRVPGGFYHVEKKDYVDAFIFFKSLVDDKISSRRTIGDDGAYA